MTSTVLILVSAALAGLFLAWPLAGEAALPLAAAALWLRVAAGLFLSLALILWDTRRRHALSRIAEVHGIRIVKPPSQATGIAGGFLLAVVVGSFGFEQRIFYAALVGHNEAGRRQGVLEFIERFPDSDRVDGAVGWLLAEPDFLEATAAGYSRLAPELRPRAAVRVLDRIAAEPPEKAVPLLAAFAGAFEGPENPTAARRLYAETIVPRLLERPPEALPDGARALLGSLGDPAGGPRIGLLVDPVEAPAPVERLAGRLLRALQDRAPFQVLRQGAEYVPRRIEIRWREAGERLDLAVRLVSGSGHGGVRFERAYEADLGGGDPHADEHLADRVLFDLVPPS